MRRGGCSGRDLTDLHEVRYKGEINLVTEADLLSEALIVERIRRSFPGHDILAEESPETTKGSCFRWIIDPLDGTTNYAHGYPIFCVSIALEVEGEILLGAVYNPMLKELFVAEKGEGASLNGRPSMPSPGRRISPKGSSRPVSPMISGRTGTTT